MNSEKTENSIKYRDPVCGMLISAGNAKGMVAYRGTTFYFCSEGCAREFNDRTEKFVFKVSNEGVDLPVGKGPKNGERN